MVLKKIRPEVYACARKIFRFSVKMAFYFIYRGNIRSENRRFLTTIIAYGRSARTRFDMTHRPPSHALREEQIQSLDLVQFLCTQSIIKPGLRRVPVYQVGFRFRGRLVFGSRFFISINIPIFFGFFYDKGWVGFHCNRVPSSVILVRQAEKLGYHQRLQVSSGFNFWYAVFTIMIPRIVSTFHRVVTVLVSFGIVCD